MPTGWRSSGAVVRSPDSPTSSTRCSRRLPSGWRRTPEAASRGPAARRLAFRELGLAIGLSAFVAAPPAPLGRWVPLAADVTSFWLRPDHRRTDAWMAHEDINDVMLATALLPDGFLSLSP